MGMSAYVQTIVGAEVTRAELFDETTGLTTNCQRCATELERKSKYCGECGHQFFPFATSRWKPLVLKAMRKSSRNRKISPEDTDREYWDQPVFSLDRETIVLGQELSHISCSDGDYQAIAFSKLDDVRARAVALFQEMGLQERELQIFQVPSIH